MKKKNALRPFIFHKKKIMLRAWSIKMVAMTRLELVTPALWVRCSNQLSYIAVNCARIMWFSHQYVKYLARLIDQNLLKWADKPGSVENDHSSRRTITHTLKRPTRIQHGPCLKDPYLVLLPVGFTMPWTVTSHAVRSYRTLSPLPSISIARNHNEGGLLSAALSVGSRRPGITWHLALWSPDFPPLLQSRRFPQQRSSGSLRGA